MSITMHKPASSAGTSAGTVTAKLVSDLVEKLKAAQAPEERLSLAETLVKHDKSGAVRRLDEGDSHLKYTNRVDNALIDAARPVVEQTEDKGHYLRGFEILRHVRYFEVRCCCRNSAKMQEALLEKAAKAEDLNLVAEIAEETKSEGIRESAITILRFNFGYMEHRKEQGDKFNSYPFAVLAQYDGPIGAMEAAQAYARMRKAETGCVSTSVIDGCAHPKVREFLLQEMANAMKGWRMVFKWHDKQVIQLNLMDAASGSKHKDIRLSALKFVEEFPRNGELVSTSELRHSFNSTMSKMFEAREKGRKHDSSRFSAEMRMQWEEASECNPHPLAVVVGHSEHQDVVRKGLETLAGWRDIGSMFYILKQAEPGWKLDAAADALVEIVEPKLASLEIPGRHKLILLNAAQSGLKVSFLKEIARDAFALNISFHRLKEGALKQAKEVEVPSELGRFERETGIKPDERMSQLIEKMVLIDRELKLWKEEYEGATEELEKLGRIRLGIRTKTVGALRELMQTVAGVGLAKKSVERELIMAMAADHAREMKASQDAEDQA